MVIAFVAVVCNIAGFRCAGVVFVREREATLLGARLFLGLMMIMTCLVWGIRICVRGRLVLVLRISVRLVVVISVSILGAAIGGWTTGL